MYSTRSNSQIWKYQSLTPLGKKDLAMGKAEFEANVKLL